MYPTKKQQNISARSKSSSTIFLTTRNKQQHPESNKMEKNFLTCLAFLMSVGALLLSQQAQALSLISEKCDPNKVGPDETTVKGGWQAEMFNGLSFRTCGEYATVEGGKKFFFLQQQLQARDHFHFLVTGLVLCYLFARLRVSLISVCFVNQ